MASMVIQATDMKRIIFTIAFLGFLQAQGQISVGSGMNVDIASGLNLVLSGNLQNNGAVTGTGKLLLSGNLAQSITGTGSINYLRIDNGSGVTIVNGNLQTVTGILDLITGTLSTNGGLTLKSSSSSDARVAQVLNGSVVGDVNVERYIPSAGRRAWRLLSVPIDTAGAPTIYSSWQEGGSSTSGYGTIITQTGGTGIGGSFDAGVINGYSSIRQYNTIGNTLSTPSSTNISIASQPAWFLFVRGDRTIPATGNNNSSSNTTLRIKGAIKTGNQDYAVLANNWTLIGNPYVSPIDFSLARGNTSSVNILNKVWVWDPKLGNVGGYVVLDGTLPIPYTPSVTGGSYNSATSTIQSGQAFFVKTNGQAGNLRIQEDDKAVSYQNVFKTTTGSELWMTIKLSMADSGAVDSRPADGMIVVFDSTYSDMIGNEDALKMVNFGPNIALVRRDTNLTIEKKSVANSNDTIITNLWNAAAGNYKLDFQAYNFSTWNKTAYLFDNYLNSWTSLSSSGSSEYPFMITNDSMSYGRRFKIVIANNLPLANNGIAINANLDGGRVVITWQVTREEDMVRYEVERSSNGNDYKPIYDCENTGKQCYSFFDDRTSTDKVYYRIKAVTKKHLNVYSKVITISEIGSLNAISVENPIVRNVVKIRFSDGEPGRYYMYLLGLAGEMISSQEIGYLGGLTEYAFEIPGLLPGIYVLKVGNGIHTKSVKLFN